jgi:hypothetical protein
MKKTLNLLSNVCLHFAFDLKPLLRLQQLLRCQYWYFFISKAIKLYLYCCADKASKRSTSSSSIRERK